MAYRRDEHVTSLFRTADSTHVMCSRLATGQDAEGARWDDAQTPAGAVRAVQAAPEGAVRAVQATPAGAG